MFLDLLNDLFVNSSVFYIYFGMFIITIGISQLLILHQDIWRIRTHLNVNHYQDRQVDSSLFEKPLVSHELFIMWFVKTCKRIDKLDSDQEDESNSYFNHHLKIRGGQLWIKTTYLQPFGDMPY